MDGNNMSPADIAALTNGNGMNEGSWIWFLLIFVLLGMNGRGAAPAPGQNGVTQAELNAAINNQTTQAQLNQLGLATQQNNYETAQLITGQTNAMLQQQNTNIVNAIQGFNSVTNQLMGQTNMLGSKIDQLGYQMEQCCCSVKTQMLQDRLADRDRQLTEAKNDLSNARQTQSMLGAMGRWVGWSGSGSQALSTGATV